VGINTRIVISAVWALHGGRSEWPTVADIAAHLETDEKVVRPLLRELKASRIFRDRRRRGETVWGPWDPAEFAR
jgi:DNA-binding IscR family transcriptional regulator